MALLLEVADYSLHNLPGIPTEVACTSRSSQWGVPGKSKSQDPESFGFLVLQEKSMRANSQVFIRKKNFETLVPLFLDEELKKVLPSTKENTKHEKMYIPIARDLYENILKFNLNRNADVRETGCVIQPLLPWLVASHDGHISDRSKRKKNIGLVEIKCPKTKHSCTYDELLADESFLYW